MDIAMSQGFRTDATRPGISLKRGLVLVAALLVAVAGLTFAPLGSPASAAPAIDQCSGIAEGGGQGIACDVTVINTLDVATGVASSTVTLKVCSGAAGPNVTCDTPTTTTEDFLVTSVGQCNSAANGGGASVICNVYVTNNIVGGSTTGVTDATVNQCNGSGEGGPALTLNCTPTDASTTGATITQCNDSVNGGGGILTVTCTVTPSTMNSQLPVSINQCNGTANGGGSFVICTASLTNNVLPAKSNASPPAKNVLNDSRTDGFTHAAGGDGFPDSLGVLVLLLAGLLTAAFAARRLGAHR